MSTWTNRFTLVADDERSVDSKFTHDVLVYTDQLALPPSGNHHANQPLYLGSSNSSNSSKNVGARHNKQGGVNFAIDDPSFVSPSMKQDGEQLSRRASSFGRDPLSYGNEFSMVASLRGTGKRKKGGTGGGGQGVSTPKSGQNIHNLASSPHPKHQVKEEDGMDLIIEDLLGCGTINLTVGELIPSTNIPQGANASPGSNKGSPESKGGGQAIPTASAAAKQSSPSSQLSPAPVPFKTPSNSSSASTSIKMTPIIRNKLDPYGQHFDPELYLAHFHKESSVDQMKLGCQLLNKVLEEKEKDMHRIVQDNFHRLLYCADVMDRVRDIVVGTRPNVRKAHSNAWESSSGGSVWSPTLGLGTVGTSSFASFPQLADSVSSRSAPINHASEVEGALDEAVKLTSQLYSPLLERRAHTEKLSRARSIIQRLSYVFEFPEKLRNSLDRGDVDQMIRDHRRVKKWIQAQRPDSPLVHRIEQEVRVAIAQFQEELFETLSEPNGKVDYVKDALDFLAHCEPNVDHITKALTIRQDKVLESIRRLRGAAAADVILRRRLMRPIALDDSEGFKEIEAAMQSVTETASRLSISFVDGLYFFWRLVMLLFPTHAAEDRYDMVHIMVSEIISEYTDAVCMVLLPSNTKHAILISRESALEVVQTLSAVERFGIPRNFLTGLFRVTDEITKAYCLSIVRSMKIVAIEFAQTVRLENASRELPEQIQILVLESLRELQEIVSPETSTAVIARNACVKAPVEAARALYAKYFERDDDKSGWDGSKQGGRGGGGGGSAIVNASSPRSTAGSPILVGRSGSAPRVIHNDLQNLLYMASCIHRFREFVIPNVGEALSDALGGEGFAPIVNGAVSTIRSIEKLVVERFVHLTAPGLVSTVVHGIVAGGALMNQLRAPRLYTREVIADLVLIVSDAKAITVGRIADTITSMLKLAVGNAFRDSVLEVNYFRGVAAEQVLLEVEFVERVLTNTKSKESFFLAAHTIAKSMQFEPSMDYDMLLEAAVDQCQVEHRVLCKDA